MKSKVGRKCFYCHKEGHYKKECPKRKKKKGEKLNQKDLGVAAVASDGYDLADILVVSSNDSGGEWLLDSGCSFHMTLYKNCFQEFQQTEGGMVLLGNNKSCKVLGISSIRFKMFDGSERLLKDVRYFPELKRNLLSIGMLDSIGCSVKIGQGSMKISKGALTLMEGELKNGLYTLVGTIILITRLMATAVNKENERAKLWHLRLGHVSERGLNELSKQGLLGNDKLGTLEFCENCIFGKSNRVKFGNAIHKTKGILDYIHSDLWGPSRIKTLGGTSYFISIIDNFSRKVWVYVLKTKDQALQAFKNWKTLIENQTNKKVKKLRTNNGWEFCSDQFTRYCQEHGIARHLTVRGTPQ